MLSLRAIRAEKAKRSLAEFVRRAWPTFEPATELRWNWVLQAICDHVQALFEDRLVRDGKIIRNLIINVPPGTSKSTVLSVCLPAWMWVRNPAWRGLFASGNDAVAIRDSLKCRTLLDSEWYRQTFRPTWTWAKDQNAKTYYLNSSSGFRQVTTVASTVVGQRANDTITDDPNGTNEGEADRQRTINWWDNAFWSRLNDLEAGHRVIIQQRVHEDDLTGHVLAKDPSKWAVLVIRMEYEQPRPTDPDFRPTPLGWTDPRTVEGELMFPERFSAEIVAEQKHVLGSAGTAGQLQQRPAPKGGLIFKEGFVRFYKRGQEPEFARLLFSLDTAFSEKASADYSVNLVGGESQVPGLMGLWLLDCWRDQVGFPALKTQAKLMAAQRRPDTVLIENKASGQSLIQELRQDTSLPVVPVKVDKDKVARANAAAPTWESGRIWVPEDAPWVAPFLAELYAFPQGKHDDQVDSLTQLINYVFLGGGSMGLLDYYRQQAAAVRAAKGGA